MTVDDDFTLEYPDGDRVSTEVVSTLIRTGESLLREVDRAMLATFGVPQAVLTSLAVIEGADTMLTPSEITERMLISSATMTATLDALEGHGWARRVPNPDDRRSVLIELTAEGQAVADRFLPGIRAVERAVVGALNSNERATMLKLLAKVLAGIAAVAAAEPIPLEGRRNRRPRSG